jgi:hypothetical protein
LIRNNYYLDDNITKRGEPLEKIYCRLCYQEESNILDPLLSPCKCSGSMKYIHYSCLKKSIKQKIQIRKEENCDLYFFKSYCCEICLESYPKYITYKTNIYNLVDIDTSRYIDYILTSIIYYSENNNSNKKQLSYLGYLIFKIDEQCELKIGRNQNNHIVLKDISISRNHCILKRENNHLKIKDVKSKFGTLLYIKNIKKIIFKKMKYKIFNNLFLLTIICIFISIYADYEPLTPKEVQEFDRMSSPVLSPDGKYVIYTIRKWTESTQKSYTNLQFTEIATKKRGFITPAVLDQSDSSPSFSAAFPNILFFQRKGKILYIPFPPDEISMDIKEDKSKILAEYNITISEYKLKNNAFVFSADVYFDCDTIECSAKK